MIAWLSLDDVLAIHDEVIDRYGGLPGIRHRSLLESALAQPENLAGYGNPNVAVLAAAYACGIARNYPFLKGNKRTSYEASRLFLQLNGYDIMQVDYLEPRDLWYGVAEGRISEPELASWYRAHIVDI